jgi:hypothetical protein
MLVIAIVLHLSRSATVFADPPAPETRPKRSSSDLRATNSWDRQRFDEQIVPILSRRCLECHNPTDLKGDLDLVHRAGAMKEGESGAALVPGDVKASLLWKRVADGEMPPEEALPEAEKRELHDWIAAGAPWGNDPIDRFRVTTDRRAGYDWWSLQPLKNVEPPQVGDPSWPVGMVDRFVLARLESSGLRPSPMASKRVLIRRVYFDLIGLPPTPAEVDAFVNDADPQAYEKLVDRLLESPRHGERWARHWLDVARFAESNGFEYDEPRRNAWPYRDWVISAFSNDMPYDQFCRWQIAGDVMNPEDPQAVTATGFLVAGAYDQAGQNQQSEAMRAVVRNDELEDIVGTVGQTFLGLTVHCARCHDHKFDPIRQTDYYRLVSAMSGIRQGERDSTPPSARMEHEKRRLIAEKECQRLAEEIAAIDAPLRQQLRSVGEKNNLPPGPEPISVWEFDDLRDSKGGLPITLHGSATIREGALLVDGKEAYAATMPIEAPIREKTLQVWVQLHDLNQRGGAGISLQSLNGVSFDSVVFGEQNAGQWMAGSEGFQRTQSFNGPIETEARSRPVRIAITYAPDGTVTAYRDGKPYGRSYRAQGPIAFAAGEAQLVFGLRHSPASGNRLLRGSIRRAELYDRALTAKEVEAAGDEVTEKQIIAHLDSATAKRRAELVQRRAEMRPQLQPVPQLLTHACLPRQPEITRVLLRGDTRQPRDIVGPGGIECVMEKTSEFGLPPDAPESERRRRLAEWITHPDNPLFARVIVNRVWHHHFGIGLVDTPNDLGFNGGRPSHPQLLDWLALRLQQDGYRLKSLHRLIVNSAAYRQASLSRPESLKIDQDNRLLWRRSPQRLEAEALRDAMLCVAGKLNHAGGGPGFRDYKEVNRSGTWSYLTADFAGPEFERRSIYRTLVRGGRGGLLDAFDCPDPSTTTPKRTVTTTPLQALALFNNSLVLRMSEAFAERLQREAGDDPADQVSLATQLAYGRAAESAEKELMVDIVKRHGPATLARVLFNSNEFLYVD